MRKSFFGIFQILRLPAGFTRRHRGREIDEPLWIYRKSAHDLQGCYGVFFPDGHIGSQTRRDESLAENVFRIEHIVVLLLRREGRGCDFIGLQGSDRICINLSRRNSYELFLRVSECRQLAAKNTTGVNVDRPIEPFCVGDRSVAIDDHCGSAIFGSPVVTHRKTEFIRFAGGFAEETKVAYLLRTPSLHLLLQARMSNHEFAAVQDVMTY